MTLKLYQFSKETTMIDKNLQEFGSETPLSNIFPDKDDLYYCFV